MYLTKFVSCIVEQMQDKIVKLVADYQNKKNKNKLEGDIGEAFVARAVKHTLLALGYSMNPSREPSTFQLGRSLGATTRKRGEGVDWGVLLFDSNGIPFEFQIEVKNWKDYGWGKDERYFEFDEYSVIEKYREIISRFKKYKSSCINTIRCTTMNRGNVHRLRPYCEADNIEIIELEDKLTDENATKEFIEGMFRGFIGQFIELVIKYIGVNNMPFRQPNSLFTSDKEEIMFYLAMGVPVDILKRKYNIKSNSYMRKLKSLVQRKYNVELVDGRTNHGIMLREL